MAKKKREAQEIGGVTYPARPEQATPAPWGYGFERHGAKWRAYKTGPTLEYLSPDRGEELHSAVAKIQAALSREINQAIRGRK